MRLTHLAPWLRPPSLLTFLAQCVFRKNGMHSNSRNSRLFNAALTRCNYPWKERIGRRSTNKNTWCTLSKSLGFRKADQMQRPMISKLSRAFVFFGKRCSSRDRIAYASRIGAPPRGGGITDAAASRYRYRWMSRYRHRWMSRYREHCHSDIPNQSLEYLFWILAVFSSCKWYFWYEIEPRCRRTITNGTLELHPCPRLNNRIQSS